MRFYVNTNEGGAQGNLSYNKRYEAAITPQDKRMNDTHIEQLKNEFMRKYSPPMKVMNDKQLLNQWLQQQELKAEDWARRNEPKRFLNPLLRPMNGIASDKVMRKNRNGNTAEISSSWVGDVTIDATGKVLTVQLPPNKKNPTGRYTYGTSPEILKQFLGSKSLGQIISHLAHTRGSGVTHSGITKLWDSKLNPEKVPTRKGKGFR